MDEIQTLKRERTALVSALDSITRVFSNEDSSRKNKGLESNAKDSYPFIPLSISHYLHLLNLVKSKVEERVKFIDYGCGIGITVLLAQELGFDAEGIEYNEKLIIRNWIKPTNYNDNAIIHANLKTYEFKKNYYDVAYWYSPFTYNKEEIEFEIKAIQSVKIGGYIICPPPSKARPCKNTYLGHPKFQKLLDGLKKVEEFKSDPIYKRVK